jgi:hypothetical protein
MARSRSAPAGPQPAGMAMPQILAVAVGAVYTLVGLTGFFVTGFGDFAGHEGHSLLGFSINPLHNILHLGVGALGLVMGMRLPTARTYGWILLLAYGVLFVFGLFAVGNTDVNFLAMNAADNVLHLLTALLGLAIALWPTRGQARDASREVGDRLEDMRR